MLQAAGGRAWPCNMPHAVSCLLLLVAAQSAMGHTSDLQRRTSCRWFMAAEIIAVHGGESHTAVCRKPHIACCCCHDWQSPLGRAGTFQQS